MDDLFFLIPFAYLGLQAVMATRMSGLWRRAALVPAVLMAAIVAWTALAFAAESNLWPLPLLLAAPLALAYLLGLAALFGVVRLVRRP